jgi:hypothetical protein
VGLLAVRADHEIVLLGLGAWFAWLAVHSDSFNSGIPELTAHGFSYRSQMQMTDT